MNWYDYDMGYGAATEDAAIKRAVDGRRSNQPASGSDGMLSLLIAMVVFAFTFLVMNLAAIATAHYVRMKYLPLTGQSEWVKTGVFIALAYGITSLITFMKGWYIELRWKGKGWWIVLFLATIAFWCGLPIYIVYVLLDGWLSPAISGVAAIVAGLLIYFFQKPLHPGAHKFTFWAYNAGKKLAH